MPHRHPLDFAMKTRAPSRREYLGISLAGVLMMGSPWNANAADSNVPTAPATGSVFASWGSESLSLIRERFWSPKQDLYTEHALLPDGRHWRGSHPSFMWGVGVQLSALNAAARVEPEKYLSEAIEYADAIEVYWRNDEGIEGFDVQPGPKDSDRYYDDNAWLVLALAELFEVSSEQRYLDRAIATFEFVMSGKDDLLGGGLYWRELEKTSKNTCTNAPAIVSALRLFQLTGEQTYLDTAKDLYAWTCANLQDKDGLFWDNVSMDGKVDERKFSYNSALMIRANVLFYQIDGDQKYLSEATRIAKAAEDRWIRENGAVDDSGRFAHLLLESFLALAELDSSQHWDKVVSRSVVYLHEHLRDQNGFYASRWTASPRRSGRNIQLLDQSSAARIYWLAAHRFDAKSP